MKNWLQESPARPQEWHRFENKKLFPDVSIVSFAQIDISDFKRSQWNYTSKQQSILISFCVIQNIHRIV